jgi:ribosomal protein S27AE
MDMKFRILYTFVGLKETFFFCRRIYKNSKREMNIMLGIKRCPKCGKIMDKLAGIETGIAGVSMAEKWYCPHCKYDEAKDFWNSQMGNITETGSI